MGLNFMWVLFSSILNLYCIYEFPAVYMGYWQWVCLRDRIRSIVEAYLEAAWERWQVVFITVSLLLTMPGTPRLLKLLRWPAQLHIGGTSSLLMHVSYLYEVIAIARGSVLDHWSQDGNSFYIFLKSVPEEGLLGPNRWIEEKSATYRL